VLNLGLNRASAVALAKVTGDVRFVADVVARLHGMYAETVLGALDPGEGVAAVVAAVAPDDDPDAVYERVWTACADALADEGDDPVPTDPRAQLLGAIEAVFRS